MLSYIEESSNNLANLVNTCNSLEAIRGGRLISALFITRSRCGPLGKAAVIEAYSKGHIPSAIIDDNKEVISECSEVCHTCHVKVRRKPFAEKAECVRNFLIEFSEPLERLFYRYC